MKILWLDDDYFRLQDLKSILESNGYKIEFCKDVQTFLKSIKVNHNISLFILDMNLSPFGLNKQEIDDTQGGAATGYVLYSNYLKDKFKKVPVIILSAMSVGRYVEKKGNDENIKFLRKPIDSNELLEIIEKLTKPAANSC